MTDVVYFVRRDALVKIGTTGGLADRIRTLNKGGSSVEGAGPTEVELLATMPGGRPVEKSIHEMFASLRYEGEWFFLDEPLISFVQAVAAAEAVARARRERALARRPHPWTHTEEYSVPEQFRAPRVERPKSAEQLGDGLVNLHQATERGPIPLRYHAMRKRLQRAKAAGKPVPTPMRREGMTDLYQLGDLIAWTEGELVS